MNKNRLNEIIKELNELSSGCTLKEIIELLTGFTVQNFDQTNSECLKLKKDILSIANSFISDVQADGGQEFDPEPESNLRTEVPSWFQREIENRMKKQSNLQIKSLGWAGYPRFELSSGYLQIKVMQSTTGDTPRSLYLSSRGLKVNKSGYHLGLLFTYDLESSEDMPYVYPTEVKLIDLSRIQISTKIEFSASSKRLKDAAIE